MISQLKLNRAWIYSGLNPLPMQMQHIERNVFEANDLDVIGTMSSKQIAVLFKAAHESFMDAKQLADASIEDDCVWIGGDVQKLIPVHVLQKLACTEQWVEIENPHYGKVFTAVSSKPDMRKTIKEKKVFWHLDKVED